MGWLIPLIFIGVPALEIALLIKVGGAIGAGWTFVLVVVTGLAGAALAKSQGLRALAEIQQSMATGTAVGRTLASGVLLLCAGVLLITPGFVTDVVGFGLLLPPLRISVARWLTTRLASKVHVAMPTGPGMADDPPPPGVIDV